MSHSCAASLCVTPHEADMPDILEMTCPITGGFSRQICCEIPMDRNELAAHISQYHTNYSEDPEPWFTAKRERRFK